MNSNDKVLDVVKQLLDSNAVPHCPLVAFINHLREFQSLSPSHDHPAHTGDLLGELSIALSSQISQITESRIEAERKCKQLKKELANEEKRLSDIQQRENETRQLYTFAARASDLYFTTKAPDSLADEVHNHFSFPNGSNEEPVLSNIEKQVEKAWKDPKQVPSSTPDERRSPNEPADSYSRSSPIFPFEGKNEIKGEPHSTFSTDHKYLFSVLQSPSVAEESVLAVVKEVKEKIFAEPVDYSENHILRIHLCEFCELVVMLSKFLLDHPPLVQVALLDLIEHIFFSSVVGSGRQCERCKGEPASTLERLVTGERSFVEVLVRLLNSVNDIVKNEALRCLLPLLSIPPDQCLLSDRRIGTVLNCSSVWNIVMDRFLRSNGLNALLSIILRSTSETCLERALVILWNILLKVEDAYFKKLFSSPLGSYVCKLGGLKSLDLFYTDSAPIVENVASVVHFLTREDDAQESIQENGGLEKIVSSLCYPSISIQSKMAGVVWNCATKVENRRQFRRLGIVPQLLDILQFVPEKSKKSELAIENAVGALRSLSVEGEITSDIIAYQGIKVLLRLMEISKNISIVMSAAGTLWNCSKSIQTSTIIRSTDKGLPTLLSLLVEPELKTRFSVVKETRIALIDTIAGILKNCAIGEENRRAIIASDGVQNVLLLLQQFANGKEDPLYHKTVDKLTSILWNLTVSEGGKKVMSQASGGFDALLKLLKVSSPVYSFHTSYNEKHFIPFARDISALLMDMNRSCDENMKKIIKLLNSCAPVFKLIMSTREKLIGIILNCCTCKENKAALVSRGAIAVLVSSFWDCFSPWSTFRHAPGASARKVSSELYHPSPQLCETIAWALWHLAKENKSIFLEQGAMEVLCIFIQGENPLLALLEPAAGALSTLTASNKENCDALLRFGGFNSLLRLAAKFQYKFPSETEECSEITLQKVVMYNILLSIRNSTCSSKLVRTSAVDYATLNNYEFAKILVSLLSSPVEDCAKEAAYIIKNCCISNELQHFFNTKKVGDKLRQLISESSSTTLHCACESALKSIQRTTHFVL